LCKQFSIQSPVKSPFVLIADSMNTFCYKLFFRNRTAEKSRFTLSLVLFLLFTNIANAATYYSKVATGNFSLVSSWTADTVGNANAASIGTADLYVIRNGHNITLNGTRTVGQVTIRSGGTMTVGGAFTLTTASPLTINLGGILGINTRTFIVAGSWTNNGSITGTTGIMQASTGTAINNGSINLSSGRVSMTGAGPLSNTGTIVLTTGQINVTTGTFNNSGTITMGAGTISQTTGTITNTATGIIDITGTAIITLTTGDFVNANTNINVDFGSSAVTVTGTDATQNIGGFVTTGRFTCSKTSGTLTVNGDINCAGITKSGAGTLNLGTDNTINCSNTVVLTAGILNGGTNTTLNVSLVSTTAWQGTGTVFSPGTGTVDFNAAGNQTLSATGTKTFYNLSFSNSGTKTNATTTVTNIYTLSGSAVASAAPTYGTGATLRYSATSRTAGAEWLATFAATGGVIIDNSSTVTANGNKVFNTGVPLTINSGSTLTTGSNDFTFSGDFINAGTWTPSTGDVTIAGGVAQNIGGFTTTGIISMTKTGGTAVLQGNVNGGAFTMSGSAGTLSLGTGLTHTFTGTWTNTDGTLQCNNSALNIDGAISGSAITFTANGGTVYFRGTSPQTIPAFTYNDVEFSGAGLKTLGGTTAVNGILTINPASELNLGSSVLTMAGSGTPLVNQGTFTCGTSTVNYTSAGSTVVTAVDYYNLDGTGGNRTFSTSADIGIGGAFTPGGGTYIITGSTVDFNGIGNQDIPTFTFNKLIVSNAGTKKISASVTVSCKTIDVNDDASVQINADGGGRLDVTQ
jgi:hypothetical protein